MSLVSGSVRLMRIFAEVHWRGASNDSRVIENIDFQGFGRCIFGTLGNEPTLLYSNISLVAFPLTPKYMTLNDLEWTEWPFYVKFSLLRTALSAIKFSPKMPNIYLRFSGPEITGLKKFSIFTRKRTSIGKSTSFKPF